MMSVSLPARARRLAGLPLVLVVFVCSLAPSSVQAQEGGRVFLGFNGVLGLPQGTFSDNVENVGWGGNALFGLRLQDSPFVIGLEGTFLINGRSRDRVPFSQTVGPRVMVEVVTTNSLVQPHLFLRVQPASGVARPYMEVLGGFKYLFTDTRIEDVDRFDDDDIASTTNFDDFALSGGAGAGLDIRLGDWIDEDTGRLNTIFLHLGVQYLFGQEAEYLAEGDLIDLDGNGRLDRDELDIRRSRTDLLIPRLGVTITF